MQRIESKLAEMSKAAARCVTIRFLSSLSDDPRSETDGEAVDDSIQRTGGGSIAERMRALQNAGLSVSPTQVISKRISRDLHLPSLPSTPAMATTPSVPLTPALSSTSSPLPPDVSRSQRVSVQTLPSPLMPPSSVASPSVVAPSPHTLIPASSFGPPSPTSSASSSPRANRLSLTDFNHTFPSIDELDEMAALKLPAVDSSITGSSKHSFSGDSPMQHHSPIPHESPTQQMKSFPARPIDPGPRPSSTPIPSIDSFNSRPASPTRSPLVPAVPRKPSNLTLNGASRSPVMPHATPPEKVNMPHTLFPATLHEFNGKSNFKVLVLDVRTRQEFETEHIKMDAVVCIEPFVLLRERYVAREYAQYIANDIVTASMPTPLKTRLRLARGTRACSSLIATNSTW